MQRSRSNSLEGKATEHATATSSRQVASAAAHVDHSRQMVYFPEHLVPEEINQENEHRGSFGSFGDWGHKHVAAMAVKQAAQTHRGSVISLMSASGNPGGGLTKLQTTLLQRRESGVQGQEHPIFRATSALAAIPGVVTLQAAQHDEAIQANLIERLQQSQGSISTLMPEVINGINDHGRSPITQAQLNQWIDTVSLVIHDINLLNSYQPNNDALAALVYGTSNVIVAIFKAIDEAHDSLSVQQQTSSSSSPASLFQEGPPINSVCSRFLLKVINVWYSMPTRVNQTLAQLVIELHLDEFFSIIAKNPHNTLKVEEGVVQGLNPQLAAYCRRIEIEEAHDDDLEEDEVEDHASASATTNVSSSSSSTSAPPPVLDECFSMVHRTLSSENMLPPHVLIIALDQLLISACGLGSTTAPNQQHAIEFTVHLIRRSPILCDTFCRQLSQLLRPEIEQLQWSPTQVQAVARNTTSTITLGAGLNLLMRSTEPTEQALFAYIGHMVMPVQNIWNFTINIFKVAFISLGVGEQEDFLKQIHPSHFDATIMPLLQQDDGERSSTSDF